MKNTNTISFYIGVIFGAVLSVMFLTFPPATSSTTTSTPTTEPTEEPEKW